jgi:hypothetical protein
MQEAVLVGQGMGALLPLQAAAAGNAGAAVAAAAAAEAQELAEAGPVEPIRVLQYNRMPVNKQGVLVSRLVLEGLSGPGSLQQRLWRQLSGSPALNLQSLDLRFATNAQAVQGSGLFWQRLLQQVPLLAELRLSGLGVCETGFEVPHLWECVGQLKGECLGGLVALCRRYRAGCLGSFVGLLLVKCRR